ncbi:hypothetical protein AB0G02_32630, partial [Actinosynnema sp. NPDC023658]|uniref:hypothetical protein n=1 Tax=Actinosynnema sp. NPDC023658 TaxID=3155465 RepID=UPI0033F5DFD9
MAQGVQQAPTRDDPRDSSAQWTPDAVRTAGQGAMTYLAGLHLSAAEQKSLFVEAGTIVVQTHDMSVLTDPDAFEDVVRVVTSVLQRADSADSARQVSLEVAAGLGTTLPPIAGPTTGPNQAIRDLRARKGPSEDAPWTVESLRLRADLARAAWLDEQTRFTQDLVLRRAEGIVTSVVGTGAPIDRDVLDDLLVVVADDYKEEHYYRRSAKLAARIIGDLGIAATAAPLENPAEAGNRALPPESVFTSGPDSKSLDEVQSGRVEKLGEELAEAAGTRAELGYLPPVVRISGHPSTVPDVQELLRKHVLDVEIAVELDESRDGAAVFVQWDLVRPGGTAPLDAPPVTDVVGDPETEQSEREVAVPPVAKSVLDDERWRHSRRWAAEWFDPRDPVSSQRIASARVGIPVTTWVRGEGVKLTSKSDISIVGKPQLDLIRDPIAYDVRAFDVDGRRVLDITTRYFLDTADVVATEEQLDRLKDRFLGGVDKIFNQGYRLPGGEQFHVTVQFTDDPADAHSVVSVMDDDARARHLAWPLNASEMTLGHEHGHQLGLVDEYVETIDDEPLFQVEAGRGQVVDDDGIMGIGMLDGSGRLLPRHLWLFAHHMNALAAANPPVDAHPEATGGQGATGGQWASGGQGASAPAGGRWKGTTRFLRALTGVFSRSDRTAVAGPLVVAEAPVRPSAGDRAPWTGALLRTEAVRARAVLAGQRDPATQRSAVRRADWITSLVADHTAASDPTAHLDLTFVVAAALVDGLRFRETAELAHRIASDLGVASPSPLGGHEVVELPAPEATGGRVGAILRKPGPLDAGPAAEWTSEQLTARASAAHRDLAGRPESVRDEASRRARGIVAVAAAPNDPDVPAGLTAIVAADLVRHHSPRHSTALAYGLAEDLGIAPGTPPSLAVADLWF